MQLIDVDGQLTLEETALTYYVESKYFDRLAENQPRNSEEEQHYLQLASQLWDTCDGETESNSRQLRVVHEATDGWPCCIVSIQLLAGNRDPRQLIVYWRSSSTDWLPSDLGFLARLAREYDCDEIVCHAASLHVELTPRDKRNNPPVVGKPTVSRSLDCTRCGKTGLEYGGIHVCV